MNNYFIICTEEWVPIEGQMSKITGSFRLPAASAEEARALFRRMSNKEKITEVYKEVM